MRPCIPQSLGSPNQGLKAVIFEGRYSKLILAMKKNEVIQKVRKRSCYCDTKLASHEGRLLNIVRADNLHEISTLYNEMPKLRVRSSLNNFVTLPFVQPRSIPHNVASGTAYTAPIPFTTPGFYVCKQNPKEKLPCKLQGNPRFTGLAK
jgi:hypothetical protein